MEPWPQRVRREPEKESIEHGEARESGISDSHCDGLAQLGLQLGGQVLLYEKLDGDAIAVLEYGLTRIKHGQYGKKRELYHLGSRSQ